MTSSDIQLKKPADSAVQEPVHEKEQPIIRQQTAKQAIILFTATERP